MRITAKGQVTIPARIRKLAGLTPGTELAVSFDGKQVVIAAVAAPVSSPSVPEAVQAVARRDGNRLALLGGTEPDIGFLRHGSPARR